MDRQLANDDSAWIGHKLADGMSAEQIEEYLKDVVDIENSVYRNKFLLSRMHFKCPKEPVPPDPPKDSLNYGNIFILLFSILFEFISCVVASAIAYFILFVAFSILLVIVFAFAFEYPSSYHMLCDAVKILAVVLSIVLITISAFMALSTSLRNRKIQIETKKNYEETMRDYTRKQLLWKYQVSLWQQECKQVEATFETSQAELKKIYSIGVLAPKYRNFVAVCSLLEYFQVGTCETMKDAYNKYDNELLLGYIISDLGKIFRSLEEIKQNQFILYSSVQSSNRLLDQLVRQSGDFYTQASEQLLNLEQFASNMDSKMSEILETSTITAYCSEEAQKELQFIRRMRQYDGIIGSSWPV